jgi:hypothetical protein
MVLAGGPAAGRAAVLSEREKRAPSSMLADRELLAGPESRVLGCSVVA